LIIRTLDVLFSMLALLVLSPFLVPISILLKLTGEGEIFFMQERVGQHGKIFKLIKFATMIKASPNIGSGTITIENDPRVLTVGKFLRKTKINELPQLLNIVKGDMSIIGPRPLVQETFSNYSEATQSIILAVKPGLSGVGSIIFRGEEKILKGDMATVEFYNSVIAPYKGKLEEWFVFNKSIYVYFLAIFLTIWVILSPNSSIAFRLFVNLPIPPDALKKALIIE